MLKHLLAAGALFVLAGTANAAQTLSDGQMDGVTAGGTALANAVSITFGEVLSDTASQTSTNVDTVHLFAIGQSFSQGVAAGGFLFQAASASHADSAASLP
ncbi:MAG TPA: hypothetical protein VKZ79_01415 [Alphaproteobacteria bacterium]|nr:hypothetical protein [Alphaproteobacteria bacterium]